MEESKKERLWREFNSIQNPNVLITAVRLPSGAIETAENREHLDNKIQYIMRAYDEELRLKSNPEIAIVGFMIV